jgi:hypothetical protein
MKAARGFVVTLIGGGAFALGFAIAGVAMAAVINFVWHLGNPNFGGATSNFRAGIYFALVWAALSAPAFVAATSMFASWRALTHWRAALLGLLAGALTLLAHLFGFVTTPLSAGWLANALIRFLIPPFIAGLLAGLSLLTVKRLRKVAAT